MHPYRPLPSPATPGTISPSKQHPQYGFPSNHSDIVNSQHHHTNSINNHIGNTAMNAGRQTSAGSSRTNHPDYSESESDGDDDKVEKDKLELRREKNRVKQRNLRLRRANHIADLERSLSDVRAEHASVQNSCNQLQQRENNLQAWVHDLESALFRNGLAGEVETLRRIWADRDAMKRPRNISVTAPVSHPPPASVSLPPLAPQQRSATDPPSVDPLSTLARAAASTASGSTGNQSIAPAEYRRLSYSSVGGSGSDQRPTLPRPSSFSRGFDNPYPTPDDRWGSQMGEWIHNPDSDRKRKRESMTEFPPLGLNRPMVNSMAGRMSESNVHTLPPIQPRSASSPSSRPLSAPYNSLPPPPLSAVAPGSNTSPKSIRISDLVSPRPSYGNVPSLVSASTSMSSNGHLPDIRREIEAPTSREGGWIKSDLSPEQGSIHFNGTRLAPLRFFKVESPEKGIDQDRVDQEVKARPPVWPGSRPVSPKTRTRASLSPSAIGTRSPLASKGLRPYSGASPEAVPMPKSA